MKISAIVLIFASSLSLFANAGIFDGIGGNLTLGKSADIQMVSEKVEMTLMRAPFPVDGSSAGLDYMRYNCTFQLRNLSDLELSVQVGFPLQSETIIFKKTPEEYDQIGIVSRYNFIAGTAREIYPVRFEVGDKEHKFRKIFLWQMKFAPHEEIKLVVSYTMGGYTGLGSLKKKPDRDDKTFPARYFEPLGYALIEQFGYVTETGNCWAGKIEKAEFILYSRPFEAYLARRGPLEITAEYLAKRDRGTEKRRAHTREMADKLRREGKNDQAERLGKMELERKEDPARRDPSAMFAGRFVRVLKPADGWQEVAMKNGDTYLKLEYAPFEPGPEITVSYLFPAIPDTPAKFDALLDKVRAEFEQELKRKAEREANPEKAAAHLKKLSSEQRSLVEAHWAGVKPFDRSVIQNLADVVREYHGIATANPDIRDFLATQDWYPVKTPPPLSPELKAHLDELAPPPVSP